MDEVLNCDHSNENYQPVLSRGAVYYAIRGGSKFRKFTFLWKKQNAMPGGKKSLIKKNKVELNE